MRNPLDDLTPPAMSDSERVAKLEQAIKLIREVEFSYPLGDTNRQLLYRLVVNAFGLLSEFSHYMERIKKSSRK